MIVPQSDPPILKSYAGEGKDNRLGPRILVEIAEGLSEAVCAEPVIRSLKFQFGIPSRITVCSDHADLFRNHPAVEAYGCIDPHLDRGGFERVFQLGNRKEAYALERHLVDHYAIQLGVNVIDRRPWICVDSFDTAEIQRFRLEDSPRPRIALAIGDEGIGSSWSTDYWAQLHRQLIAALGATVIQMGHETWPALDGGINLIARLTSREAAAALMSCEVLICGDNGYLNLAAGVQTPVIAILTPRQIVCRMESSWGTGVEISEGETDVDIQKKITRIVQTATAYCRRNHRFNYGIDPS